MPLFNPSRLAVVVISCSLITFLWTYGLPHPLAVPVLPAIGHHADLDIHKDPLASTQNLQPIAQAHATDVPDVPDVPEYEEDGGRWEDKSPQNITHHTNETNTTLVTEDSHVHEDAQQLPTHDVADFCKDVPGAQHVMVVIRTSKAEVKDRLPTHLKNLLQCVPNFAMFSDHLGEIDGYTVHNALESISGDTKRAHDEFREYQIMHADAEHKPNPGNTRKLDKWKFLPMVYRAYHLRPSARFFIFIEADTGLSWTNLLQWVDRLDYRIPYYSGDSTSMSDTQISRRGSGIMLSQGALRRYVKSYDELYTSKWESIVAKECCGDLALALALNDAHVELYSAWPMLQNERPSTLDYTKKLWCVPAISWHPMDGDDLSDMWEKEKAWTETRGWDEPYLYRDAFHDYIESQMEIQKDEWDNLSEDAKIIAPRGRQKQIKEEAERRKKQEEAERQKQEVEAIRKQKESERKKLSEEGEYTYEEEDQGYTDKEIFTENEDNVDKLDHEKEGGQNHKGEGQKKATGGKKLKEEEQAEKDRKMIEEFLSKGSTNSSNSNLTKSSSHTKLGTDLAETKPSPKSTIASTTVSAKPVAKREDKKTETPDWDHIAQTHADAGDSSDRCQKACNATAACLQWRYTTAGDGECHLGGVSRLGKKTEKTKKTKGEEKWVSGWFRERIVITQAEWACKSVNWKFYQ